jgi:urease accessory protein
VKSTNGFEPRETTVDEEQPLTALLGSLQLADSFFPSGLYTLSHGIESFAQAGLLTAQTLASLIADMLQYSIAPTDGAAVALAMRAAAEDRLETVAEIDRRLTAVKITREPRETSIKLGRQLLILSRDVFSSSLAGDYLALVDAASAPGNQAVAFALLKTTLDIPVRMAVAAELYSFAAGCVGAAVRMSEIDHRNAQRILLLLKPVIESATRDALDYELHDIGGSAPFIELMSMHHETAELRLFSS